MSYISQEDFSKDRQMEFMDEFLNDSENYNPFNLFFGNFGNLDSIYFLDIYHRRKINLKRGYLYGLSNNLFMYSVSLRTKIGLDYLEVIKYDYLINRTQ